MLKNLKVILRRHTVALYYFKNNDSKLNYMPGREINVGNRKMESSSLSLRHSAEVKWESLQTQH